MATKTKQDPANYRAMSEPFKNPEEVNDALVNFYEAVEKARKQFRIADVHVVVKMNYITSGGDEAAGMTNAHYGNSLEAAPMCAWALGKAQAEFEEIIGARIKRSSGVGG
jgi:hypothetical protein